jgi:hypothetical protein
MYVNFLFIISILKEMQGDMMRIQDYAKVKKPREKFPSGFCIEIVLFDVYLL